MVDGFTTTYAISAYHHWSCEFEPCSGKVYSIQSLCDKVCQLLATGRWFSPGTLVSFTNETESHDITEILLNMALNSINQTSSNLKIKLTSMTFRPDEIKHYLRHFLYCLPSNHWHFHWWIKKITWTNTMSVPDDNGYSRNVSLMLTKLSQSNIRYYSDWHTYI